MQRAPHLPPHWTTDCQGADAAQQQRPGACSRQRGFRQPERRVDHHADA